MIKTVYAIYRVVNGKEDLVYDSIPLESFDWALHEYENFIDEYKAYRKQDCFYKDDEIKFVLVRQEEIDGKTIIGTQEVIYEQSI